MAELPWTDAEFVASCQADYQNAARHGGQEAHDSTIRLAWALVHSEKRSDVDRGLEILGALLTVDESEKRDLQYLLAVGQYRRRYYLDARATLQALLQDHPDSRQARSLLEGVESDIVKDGLIGVGAGATVAVAVGAVLYALLKK